MRLARYQHVLLISYGGHEAGLSSWWVHHSLPAQPPGRGLVAIPHNLTSGGHTFETRFVAKSAHGSS